MNPGLTAEAPAHFSGPVFITGMWRSGASLLHALLNKHPEVALMYEADLALLRPAFRKGARSDWVERWEIWNGAPSRHGLDPAKLPAAAVDFSQALETAARSYAARRGARIWGDKSPDLFDRLVPMAAVFPGARFIVVWRNPAAACSSMAAAASQGATFFAKRGMMLRGLIGFYKLRQQCDRLKAAGVPVCEVHYEDLVSNPCATMQKVCAFLELSYFDDLATLEGADRGSIHAGKHHANLRGSKIVADARLETLTNDWQRKIKSYLIWWKSKGDDSWPRVPLPLEGTVPLGAWERFWDQVHYGYRRGFDLLIRLGFCYAPISLLRWHRHRKGR